MKLDRKLELLKPIFEQGLMDDLGQRNWIRLFDVCEANGTLVVEGENWLAWVECQITDLGWILNGQLDLFLQHGTTRGGPVFWELGAVSHQRGWLTRISFPLEAKSGCRYTGYQRAKTGVIIRPCRVYGSED